MEIKKCGKCEEEKLFSEFSKCKKNKFGLSSQCKKCHAEYRREHYIKNKEKVIKQVNEYRNGNPEKYSYKPKLFNKPNKKAGRVHQSSCYICNNLIYVTRSELLEGKKNIVLKSVGLMVRIHLITTT
jgi:hypothetical protein